MRLDSVNIDQNGSLGAHAILKEILTPAYIGYQGFSCTSFHSAVFHKSVN